MDSINYFNKRDVNKKGKKRLDSEWKDLKKVWANQRPKEKLENKEDASGPKKGEN